MTIEPYWHRDHYSGEQPREPLNVSRRGRKQRSEQAEAKYQKALMREQRRLAREAKTSEWEKSRKAWQDNNNVKVTEWHQPIIVTPTVKRKKLSPAVRSEQLIAIATEIFGGRYYCVGDQKDVEVNPEPATGITT